MSLVWDRLLPLTHPPHMAARPLWEMISHRGSALSVVPSGRPQSDAQGPDEEAGVGWGVGLPFVRLPEEQGRTSTRQEGRFPIYPPPPVGDDGQRGWRCSAALGHSSPDLLAERLKVVLF